MNTSDILLRPITRDKYGITEKKKQELDTLTKEVQDAQGEVEQLQSIVDSLTDKSNKLQTQLTDADNNKAQALSNKDLLEEVIDNAADLTNNSRITLDSVVLASSKIKTVATDINTVINKLIYSAEVVNKLANLVIRKKAVNPLISDELITMITTAGTDANNAVALTLTALKSVFTAQATTLEGEAAMSLEYLQVVKLYEFITGKEADGIKNEIPKVNINILICDAYEVAKSLYDQALIASKDTTRQLNLAKSQLSAAQVNLSSLEAGLAAAQAAALSS